MLTIYLIPSESNVQSCHTCHTRSAKEPGYKAYHTRIPMI